MALLMLAASMVAAWGAEPGPGRRPVVLVTDCGASVDDEWALAHLAASPAFDLRGVITTHAPTLAPPSAESSARAARAWLDRFPGGARPRVVAGSSHPLDDREGPAPAPGAGAAYLIEESRGYTAGHRLDVVLIGAATDVAEALRADPALADRVAIVAMAFDGWPAGGDPWNVKNDPRAWRELLASRVPIVVGDDAVCRRHLQMTPARARQLLGPRGAPLSGMLGDWLARNGTLAATLTGRPDAMPIWDEVAVACLLGLTRQETRPRPGLRNDLTFDLGRPVGTITWVTAIDADRLWADLATSLAR